MESGETFLNINLSFAGKNIACPSHLLSSITLDKPVKNAYLATPGATAHGVGGGMIEIKNLVRRFGPFIAVDDISFSVGRGEVLGFLGPNGAGKSTTMKMIAGFLAPTAGSVIVCGADIEQELLKAKSMIGYLPEGAPAYPDMTPASFLNFIADVRGLSGAKRTNRLSDVIARVELASVLHQPIDTLSKGFKRRVGVAQAILHDPPVLILDEPTDGLDPNQKHEVRNLIRSMAKDKAIIVSTHILEEVEAICTRAVIIARGKLLTEGVPAGASGWRFGDYVAEPGKLDELFRFVTTNRNDGAVA